MCGRYNIIPRAEEWLDAFEILDGREVIEGLPACCNVVLSASGTINARAETVAKKNRLNSRFQIWRMLWNL